MRGFAERYRNESTIALDLLIDSAQLRAPDASAARSSRFTVKHLTT